MRCLVFRDGEAVRERRSYLIAERDRAAREARSREELLQHRVDEERLRIARELHDVIVHSIVTMKARAAVAVHVVDRQPHLVRQALLDISALGADALRDLRAALGTLRDEGDGAPRQPLAGLVPLPQLVEQVRAAGIRIKSRPCPSRRAP